MCKLFVIDFSVSSFGMRNTVAIVSHMHSHYLYFDHTYVHPNIIKCSQVSYRPAVCHEFCHAKNNEVNYITSSHLLRFNGLHWDITDILQIFCRYIMQKFSLLYILSFLWSLHLIISSVKRQKGLTTSHLHTQLNPFACKLSICYYTVYTLCMRISIFSCAGIDFIITMYYALCFSKMWHYQRCLPWNTLFSFIVFLFIVVIPLFSHL